MWTPFRNALTLQLLSIQTWRLWAMRPRPSYPDQVGCDQRFQTFSPLSSASRDALLTKRRGSITGMARESRSGRAIGEFRSCLNLDPTTCTVFLPTFREARVECISPQVHLRSAFTSPSHSHHPHFSPCICSLSDIALLGHRHPSTMYGLNSYAN